MWIKYIKLENIRTFISEEIHFSKKINILVSKNNSGKSTIINSILGLQYSGRFNPSYNRVGCDEKTSKFNFLISKHQKNESEYNLPGITGFEHHLIPGKNEIYMTKKDGNLTPKPSFSQNEPSNLLYCSLSRHKNTSYREQISLNEAKRVDFTNNNLSAKVDQLNNPNHEKHSKFNEICNDLFGFVISSVPSSKGKLPAYFLDHNTNINIHALGDGIKNMLELLVHILTAKNKIFLIEEPENDIHPQALKKLLELIETSSLDNQYIISTHSNIVVRTLGGLEENKIFRLDTKYNDITPVSPPITKIHEMNDSSEERWKLLSDLGYEQQDLEQWAGWLFLEESSAEKIIRQYLIPWFIPNLSSKLRTFACNGKDEVKRRFDEFKRLFVYLHLSPVYKNKTWIILDDGDEEKQILNDLKDLYTDWSVNQFLQFNKHDFEEFYPLNFQDDVKKINTTSDKQQKRKQKKDLLEKVEQWIKEDDDKAKELFEKSAENVIEKLRMIEEALSQS